MSTSKIIVGLLAVGAVVLGTSLAQAQDWPQWRGVNRDGKAAAFTAPDTWPEQLNEKWKVAVGTGDAPPALVGDRLYVFARQGSEEVILCLDAATGDPLWDDKYAAPNITGPAAGHQGPRGAPAVAEGKVCTLGVAGVVSCLDAESGKLMWRKDDSGGKWPQFFASYSPIIVDGMCVAHVGGSGNGPMIAYDLATGDKKWTWPGDGPSYSSPVLMTIDGTKLLVTLTEKKAVAVDLADGSTAWEMGYIGPQRTVNAVTPIVDGQTMYLTTEGLGTKAFRLVKKDDGYEAEDLWANTRIDSKFSTPVLKDGFLYGVSGRGNVFCINAKDGETAWTNSANHGQYGGVVDAGSVLMAMPTKPNLIVFKPDATAYSELANIKVADTEVYAYPVVSGKRIFIKDQNNLILWTVD